MPVKGEDNTFAPKPLKPGPVYNGMIPIISGCKQGDEVVMRGAYIHKAELGKREAGHGH